MAYATIQFNSRFLNRTVEFQAILPEPYLGKEPLKTLYLLHGAWDNSYDWIRYSRLPLWVREKNLAVILPTGENRFYVDNPRSLEYFSRFIGEEMVEFTRALLPLSHRREDTFIGGLSMGGYGTIVNGLRYRDTFGRIAALSPALRLDQFPPEAAPDSFLLQRCYLEDTFGPLDQVPGSDMDYMALAARTPKDRCPGIYLCCGTEDKLLPCTRAFRDRLRQLDLPLTYEEGPGGHDWIFWDQFLQRILAWLPLGASEGR